MKKPAIVDDSGRDLQYPASRLFLDRAASHVYIGDFDKMLQYLYVGLFVGVSAQMHNSRALSKAVLEESMNRDRLCIRNETIDRCRRSVRGGALSSGSVNSL